MIRDETDTTQALQQLADLTQQYESLHRSVAVPRATLLLPALGG